MLRFACGVALVVAWVAVAAAQEKPQLIYVTGKPGNPELMFKKDGADPSVLAKHAASDIWPNWSKNGERVAFASNRSGLFQIHAMNADGGALAQLSLERNGESLHPSWSPTGNHLVFQHGYSKHWDLVVIAGDGSEWRRIVHNAWQPDWSREHPKGDRIAFISAAHDAGVYIYTCEPDGSDIRRIHRLTGRCGQVDPVWSPDASRIAFADAKEKSFEIFTCGREGQDVKQMTALGGRNLFPVWSPDGKQIYFWHMRADNSWQWMSLTVETRKADPMDMVPLEGGFIRGGRMTAK